jgi:N-acetylglucosaminyl-diphospho-decaprenol L-rhamnosyltransferase
MVSVIVVSYNCKNDLRKCLQSLRDVEVIVVDNASSDGSAGMVGEEFSSVKVIRNDANVGFGAGNNRGLDIAGGEFALLLNPDAVASEGAISALEHFMQSKPKCVACGGSLWFQNGRLQDSACNRLTLWAVFCEQTYLEKLFKHSPVLSRYWVSWRCGEPCRVAQVMGACLLMRRVDGEFLRFDERFFLYCEDTELCERLSKRGEIWYVPDARFTHALGASSEDKRWRSVAYYNRGKELFFEVHRGRVAAAACLSLNRFGACIRLLFWSLATIATIGKFRKRIGLWWRVLFAPLDPYTAWRRDR